MLKNTHSKILAFLPFLRSLTVAYSAKQAMQAAELAGVIYFYNAALLSRPVLYISSLIRVSKLLVRIEITFRSRKGTFITFLMSAASISAS